MEQSQINGSSSTLYMIHGWLEYAQRFQDRTTQFTTLIGNTPVEYISAPLHPSKEDLQAYFSGIKEEDIQSRTWFYPKSNRTVYAYWKYSIKYLLQDMKGKTVRGLLGFSQGGFIVTILSALITLQYYGLLNMESLPKELFERKPEDDDETTLEEVIELIQEVFFPSNGQCTLKYVILVGALKANASDVQQMIGTLHSNHLNLGSGIFKSLHIYGLADQMVTPDKSKTLAEDWFDEKQRTILIHSGKHIVPNATTEGFDAKALLQFFQLQHKLQ